MALAKGFCRVLVPRFPEKKVVPQKDGGFEIHLRSQGKNGDIRAEFFRDPLCQFGLIGPDGSYGAIQDGGQFVKPKV
jgi:hypothetical protein